MITGVLGPHSAPANSSTCRPARRSPPPPLILADHAARKRRRSWGYAPPSAKATLAARQRRPANERWTVAAGSFEEAGAFGPAWCKWIISPARRVNFRSSCTQAYGFQGSDWRSNAAILQPCAARSSCSAGPLFARWPPDAPPQRPAQRPLHQASRHQRSADPCHAHHGTPASALRSSASRRPTSPVQQRRRPGAQAQPARLSRPPPPSRRLGAHRQGPGRSPAPRR